MTKARTTLEFLDNYCVIDLETTDYSIEYGDILEIGILKVRNNIVVDSFQKIIYHEWYDDYDNDDYIDFHHKIKKSESINAVHLQDALIETINFIGDDAIVGHNVLFDINFLNHYTNNHFEQNKYIDTMRISKFSKYNFENKRLATIKKFFNIKSVGHRSIPDCRATHEIYQIFKNDNIIFPKKNPPKKFDMKLLTSTNFDEIDDSNPFYSKNICMSGNFKLSKKEFGQILVNCGAIMENSVTKKTDILIVGDLKFQLERFGEYSSKHKKALEMKKNGSDIIILDENTFYSLLEI